MLKREIIFNGSRASLLGQLEEAKGTWEILLGPSKVTTSSRGAFDLWETAKIWKFRSLSAFGNEEPFQHREKALVLWIQFAMTFL